MKKLKKYFFQLLILGVILVVSAGVLRAQDLTRPNVSGTLFEETGNFRVNYKVLRAESTELLSSGKTIFCDGNVYDFVDNSDEIVVFNPKSRQICVLDVKNRKKLSLTPADVESYSGKICQWGRSNPKEEVRQFFQPDFKINYDDSKKEYSFVSENFSYFVTPVKPVRPEFLEQYRYFARWSCRTNMMLSPGSKTLYVRSLVNETVFNSGTLIERLQLSLRTAGPFGKSMVFLSEYQYLPRLVESDMATIRQVEDYLALFSDGSLEDFQARRLESGN